MTLSVAVSFRDGSVAAVPVDCGDPASWTQDDAKGFLYGLYDVLKAHGVYALDVSQVGLGLRLDIWADSGRLTTPAFNASAPPAWHDCPPARLWPHRTCVVSDGAEPCAA